MTDNGVQEIKPIVGTGLRLNDVNNDDVAVGSSTTAGGKKSAIVVLNGKVIDLNKVSAPLHFKLQDAMGINDRGQIICNIGGYRGCLLTPIIE